MSKLKEKGLENIKIIWSMNGSHLFECSTDDALIDFLNVEAKKYSQQNDIFDKTAFGKDLLKRWTRNEISLNLKRSKSNKNETTRKKTGHISISVERAIYNKLKDEIRGSFTVIQLLDFKKYMQLKVKE